MPDEPVCLEASDDCAGPVAYHTVGQSDRAWPRCDYHIERRWQRYEGSIERYADSDVAPDWFDPTYAGETWSDE